jgi:hypothetical protein
MREVYLDGGEDAFFNALQAQRLEFEMSPMDGIFGDWDAGQITMEELSAALKAGSTTEENAGKIWQGLFAERSDFTFSSLDIRSANLSWGYASESTWGAIHESHLVIKRQPDAWQLQFKGGTFSQGIFRDLKIQSLRVLAKKSGKLIFQEAEMSARDGTVSWTGELVESGAAPVFQCEGQFRQFPLPAFLPPALRPFVTGALSGTLSAQGSPNDRKGIQYELNCALDDEASVIFTSEVPLVQMISALDTGKRYRRLVFNEGSFQLATNGPFPEISR